MKPKIKNINLQIEFILSALMLLFKHLGFMNISMYIVALPIVLKIVLGVITIIIINIYDRKQN